MADTKGAPQDRLWHDCALKDMEYERILPLRMIAFQVLFLLVAIAIESSILRQRLRFGFKTSVQYTLAINLAAVAIGWIVFLVVEPLTPTEIRSQIISYILFDRLSLSSWNAQIGATICAVGLSSFLVTFFIKLKGLELIMRSDGSWEIEDETKRPGRRISRDERYARARQGKSETQQALSEFMDAVIRANAASFSAISLLLLLRALLTREVV